MSTEVGSLLSPKMDIESILRFSNPVRLEVLFCTCIVSTPSTACNVEYIAEIRVSITNDYRLLTTSLTMVSA